MSNILSWSRLAVTNMEATLTTGKATSREPSFTELGGMDHTLIFLKVLVLAVYRDSHT